MPAGTSVDGRADVVRVSVVLSNGPVRVAAPRRTALAEAALRALPDLVCRGTAVTHALGSDAGSGVLVEGVGEDHAGRPLLLAQWMLWREDERTLRVLLAADPARFGPARAAVASALAQAFGAGEIPTPQRKDR
ncbi:MAG: hypothetical protein NZ523_06915 [Elioraea sp.]|nr:hypothetical protein [Elioraea sp.]